MDNSPLVPSEDGSDISTEPLSETKSNYSFRETQIEGSGHIYNDVDLVSLDTLRVEDRHRQQGIRILIHSIADSLHLRYLVPSDDKCEWLALHTEFPLHTDSASSKQKPEHRVLAVRQSHDDVKFSFRIPAKIQNEQSWPPLWCEFYYGPASNNVIFLNRSDVPVDLQSQSPIPRAPYTVEPGMRKRVGLETWRISMQDTAILDLRILEKREPDHTMALKMSDTTPSTQSFSPQPDSHENKTKFAYVNPLFDIEDGRTISVSGGDADQYQFTKYDTISTTSLSTVYSAEHSESSGLIAVNVLKTSGIYSSRGLKTTNLDTVTRQADMWLRETRALKALQDNSIVRYYGHDARFLSIYMELVDAQDLAASPRWRDNADFQGSEGDALRIGRDIAGGLLYIHNHGLVHNDDKPANILYSPERGGVICDFCLSTTTSNPLSSGGTPYYIPPEFIGTRSRGMAGDVWGIGITMLYVLRKIGFPEKRASSEHPRRLYWMISGVNNPRITHKKYGNGASATEHMRDWLSDVENAKGTLNRDDLLQRLVMDMLEMNPKKRITAKELVQALSLPAIVEESPNNSGTKEDRRYGQYMVRAGDAIRGFEQQYGGGTSSAFSSLAKSDGDCTKISDLAERRKIQTRTAQHTYLKKLERRASSLDSTDLQKTNPSIPKTKPTTISSASIKPKQETLPSKAIPQMQFTLPMESNDELFLPPTYDSRLPGSLSREAQQKQPEESNIGHEGDKNLDPVPLSGFQMPVQRRLSRLYNDTRDSSDFMKEPFFPNEEVSDIRDLVRKLRIQKDRLVGWGFEWTDRTSAEIDESVSKACSSELVASILSTIKDILAEVEPLWLNFKHLTEPNRQPENGKPIIIQEDKARFEDLVRDLASSIDLLYDLSRTRAKEASQPPPSKVPLKDTLPNLEEGARNLEELALGDAPMMSSTSFVDFHGGPLMFDDFYWAEAVPSTDSGYASTLAKGTVVDSLKKNESQPPPQIAEEVASEDVSDTATQYSMASSVSFSRRNILIRELASDLFTKISSSTADENTQARVSTILPELLKAFALMVGYDAPSRMHREFMAFVHRHRRDITAAFMEIGFNQDVNGRQGSGNPSDAMDWQDRMRLWFDKENDDEGLPDSALRDLDLDLDEISLDQVPSEDFGMDETNEEEGISEKWLLAYQDLLSGSDAYKWLLSRLRREFCLVPTEPNSIKEIRDKVAVLLPKTQKISRKQSSQVSKALFEVQWDILGFFEAQNYSSQAHEAFEDVITLTGSLQDAQAATCAQYILQTWPSTGEMMIKLIKGVLQSADGFYQHSVPPKRTSMSAWIVRPKFMVEIQDTSATVTEVAEQLAWLGAALRASPKQEGLVHCTPIIRDLPRDSIPPYPSRVNPLIINLACLLEFTLEDILESPESVNGRCWHDIFKNAVIVRGYPIPRRAENHTGLEISLNIMAGLVGSQRVDQFKGRLYIKGFSAMLLLTKRSDDSIYWHLIYNKDGNRISYLDDSKFYTDQNQHIGQLDMEGCQHILGWCSESRFYAGSAEASHLVAHSGLPRAHDGCALGGIKVLPGRMILDGPKFAPGAKDKPVHVTHKGNIRRLKWISSKFFLLWDKRDERGWLINGTSALLHVVRASLSHSGKDPFRSAFLFKSEDMQEAKTPYTTNSAVEVLLSNHNRNLKLYEDDEEAGGHLLLKTQIDHFYNLMEKLIDHQADIAGEDGMKLSDRPRRYLEGWDFEDLTTDCDPLRPRVATIGTAGKGWIDFIRAIHAVVLVGSGFGDIIRPCGPHMCESWAELPKNRFYIASCLSDLERPMKEAGGYDDRVWLTKNLICHTPSTLFMSCRCRDGVGENHDEPVQVLLPSALANSLGPRTDRMEPRGSGAIIFGHHSKFTWIWGDTGPPQPHKLTEADTAFISLSKDFDSFKDSGIGLRPQPSMPNKRSLGGSGSELLSRMTRKHEDSTASMDRRLYSRDQYTVGIICALPKELMAVRVLFDAKHHGLRMGFGDDNQYALGEMASHQVVAACLPAGEHGTNSAACVASNMKRSFPSLRFCLLVGIAGGAPSAKHDVRLGDVVVGQPTGTNPGVLQYDLGKSNEGDWLELTGVLQRPPRVLTNAINALRSDPELRADPLRAYLGKIFSYLPDYGYPGSELDILLPSPCTECDSREIPSGSCTHVPQRVPRGTSEPVIHYGIVASGNRAIKDTAFRDRLVHEYDVLCFEMEAAGVVNAVDCLVIRGIWDYCDGEKNNIWQEYAAATAAAYAKLLLGVVGAVEEDTARSGWRNDEELAIKKRKWMQS